MTYKLSLYDVNDRNRLYVAKYLGKGCLDHLNIFWIQHCYAKALSVDWIQHCYAKARNLCKS